MKLYRGANLPEKALNELKKNIGNLIIFKEILSTTEKKKIALRFSTNAIFQITVKKYLKTNNFRSLTARNAIFVENITDVKGENEVIFPSGSGFIVEDIYLSNKKSQFYKIKIIIPLYVDYVSGGLEDCLIF